jgi:hypothetical protein
VLFGRGEMRFAGARERKGQVRIFTGSTSSRAGSMGRSFVGMAERMTRRCRAARNGPRDLKRAQQIFKEESPSRSPSTSQT